MEPERTRGDAPRLGVRERRASKLDRYQPGDRGSEPTMDECCDGRSGAVTAAGGRAAPAEADGGSMGVETAVSSMAAELERWRSRIWSSLMMACWRRISWRRRFWGAEEC